MKTSILFSLLILFTLSCSDKENGYIYPGMIHAGQSSGVGISYVDVEPNELIVKKDNHYGDTTKVLDLNNDGIADFELTHYAFASMQSQHEESLKITALGQNSVCTVPTENNWVSPLNYMDTINEKLNWSDSTSILYTVYSHWSMNTGWIDEVSGYWFNYESIYIGVRITADNRQLYGWIDMSGNVLRQYAVTEPYLE